VSWLTRSLPLLADPLSAPSDPCQVTFLTRQVEGLLRAEANANATMVSISINDNTQQCADEQELAVRRAEGADSGPMIRAINVIATRDHVDGSRGHLRRVHSPPCSSTT
jgi:hypothetical protein